ncbi:hypothetical protein K435DRAFT_879288 [Dendrothele bispora CBS 962.96]|uniref:Extracellular membrane protein CFEM domain-containing protein n=1 Tax=Dendrothele bispora (strain CBS 962.96) TaxID=1314807 RepID=A0A4S8KLP9_DENBC|nr:hypothetical protein K435DRAFT_879288 [Dendrothele bispora CBS 962.96]
MALSIRFIVAAILGATFLRTALAGLTPEVAKRQFDDPDGTLTGGLTVTIPQTDSQPTATTSAGSTTTTTQTPINSNGGPGEIPPDVPSQCQSTCQSLQSSINLDGSCATDPLPCICTDDVASDFRLCFNCLLQNGVDQSQVRGSFDDYKQDCQSAGHNANFGELDSGSGGGSSGNSSTTSSGGNPGGSSSLVIPLGPMAFITLVAGFMSA